MTDESAKRGGTALRIGGVFGGLVGAAVGRYSGISLMIPLMGTGLVWWISTKLLDASKKSLVPSLSVNAGHFIWLSVALFVGGSAVISQLGLDVVVYAVGLSWLLIRPGAGPIYLLGLLHMAGLVFNSAALSQAAFGTTAHKALVVHLIWRLLALGVMARLWIVLRAEHPHGTHASAP
jgi:hypothetical protein